MLVMRVPYRTLLPAVLGSISAGLVLWDLSNLRVIRSMGMAWDTGAPIWPYEAARLLLSALNAPAFVLVSPLFLLPHLEFQERRYLVLLPAIVIWWWWAGTHIDLGIPGPGQRRRPRLTAIFAAAVGAALLVAGAATVKDCAVRYSQFPPTHPLIIGRLAAFAIWCFILSAASLLAARRLWFREYALSTDVNRGRPILLCGIGLTVMAALATSLVATLWEPRRDPDSCVASEATGCIHGTVLNESGGGIGSLEIEAISSGHRDNAPWPTGRYEWTDAKGRFNFDRLEPGTYLIAVHNTKAPHESASYVSSFYPGTEEEAPAEEIVVTRASKVFLKEFRIRSLALATVEVTVMWSDGTKPPRSNLMFHNLSFPNQAVIGDVAPQIDDGHGSLRAPVGFSYEVRANVQCDAGDNFEFRESPPESITIKDQPATVRLILRIPGPPCPLWHPQ